MFARYRAVLLSNGQFRREQGSKRVEGYEEILLSRSSTRHDNAMVPPLTQGMLL